MLKPPDRMIGSMKQTPNPEDDRQELYRAVDNTIDLRLPAHRDKLAARPHFETTITQRRAPDSVTSDLWRMQMIIKGQMTGDGIVKIRDRIFHYYTYNFPSIISKLTGSPFFNAKIQISLFYVTRFGILLRCMWADEFGQPLSPVEILWGNIPT
jgi:hypothetical protein